MRTSKMDRKFVPPQNIFYTISTSSQQFNGPDEIKRYFQQNLKTIERKERKRGNLENVVIAAEESQYQINLEDAVRTLSNEAKDHRRTLTNIENRDYFEDSPSKIFAGSLGAIVGGTLAYSLLPQELTFTYDLIREESAEDLFYLGLVYIVGSVAFTYGGFNVTKNLGPLFSLVEKSVRAPLAFKEENFKLLQENITETSNMR